MIESATSGNFIITTLQGKPFLHDKVALINGLSADIGVAIGRALLLNGAHVTGTYCVNRSPLNELQAHYGDDRVVLFELDLMREGWEEVVRSLVEQTHARFGHIDVLINVTGILTIQPFLYETRSMRDRIWRINYHGALTFTSEVVRTMIARGRGDIINIASTAGMRGAGQLSAYAASKAALISLTMSLADEFAPRHIKCNAISPNTADTKALDAYLDDVGKELMIKSIPRGRFCAPEDVAHAVLAILMNDYLTGANIVLHGGRL